MPRTQRGRVPGICGTLDRPPIRSATIISEFYRLRRTAIKDIAAYLGFLVGFIGSAPFAWGLLAVQLDSGRFARGLWYFFGIVTTAGIFAGIAGMGLGIAAGLLWEQLHRYRRGRRTQSHDDGVTIAQGEPELPTGRRSATQTDPPRLQLITPSPIPLPNLTGRRVTSVRFSPSGVDVDFGGLALTLSGATTAVSTSSGRYTYPENGSRDALCGLIGSRVVRIRAVSGDRVEIFNDNGDALVIPRSAAATDDGVQRKLNES